MSTKFTMGLIAVVMALAFPALAAGGHSSFFLPPAVWFPMASIFPRNSNRRRLMSIAYFAARSPQACQFSSRPNSSW
jgi:hypothetical protein